MGEIRNPSEIVDAYLMTRDRCDTCGGTGEGPIASEHDCSVCCGAGFVPRSPEVLGEELKRWCEQILLEGIGDLRGKVQIAMCQVDWTLLASECARSRARIKT
jgi:hypothetical protein